jgi:hypothetical protein
MGEYSPHGEYEELPYDSAIGHYYFDVNKGIYSDGHARLVVGEMLRDLPFVSELTISMLTNSEYMPFDLQYEIEPRIAKEKLLLMPLAMAGPRIDESYCSTNEVKDWYTDVVAGIIQGTQGDHGDKCFKGKDNTIGVLCDSSTMCPRRYLDLYLRSNTLLPDFSSFNFMNNPNRARTIALDKLGVGVRYGILPPLETEQLSNWYQIQFEQWMSSRRDYQTRNRDN